VTVREAVLTRKSVRKYKDRDKAVHQEQIDLLLEAAMKAPSACNMRPWEFLVVQSRDKLDALAESQPFTRMLYDCPLAIVVVALPDTRNQFSEGFFPQDCGAAAQNILLQAAELGLGTCWCGIYPKETPMQRVRDALGGFLAPNAIPFNIIAVGHPDEDLGARGFYEKAKVKYI
jgi:nitroreductase